MTRKRRQPQIHRVDLTATLDNPRLLEHEVEYSLDAPNIGDVWQCGLFAGFAAACGFGLAHWAAWLRGIPGYAMQVGLAGLVGLFALVGYAVMLHYSRRARQWATFDRQPEGPQTKNFVPTSDGTRTLVLDTPLRRKLTQWAQLLPAADYSLTYRRWTGQGELFSRQEFDRVRGMMAAQGLMKGNEITDAGRAAVGRWSVGNMTADEIHGLRGEG